MNKELTLIARFLALLAALVLAGLLALTITAFAAQRQFLRAEPYKAALLEVNAYERSPGILAEFVATALDNSPTGLLGPLPLPNLTQQDLQIFLTVFLPRDWLQSQTEVVVDRAIAGLTGQPAPVPTLLSLAPLKEQLNSPAGTQALLAVINQRPACEAGDLSAFTCGFNLQGDIACRPPSLNQQLCGAAINAATAGIASLIPDQVELESLLALSEPLTAPLRDYAGRYASAISLIAIYGWLAALLMLFAITILGVRSFTGWLRWWGGPLLGAALCLLPVTALTVLSPAWYVSALIGELRLSLPALAEVAADVVEVLSQGLVLQLVIAMVILSAAGAGMVALSFVGPPVYRWFAQS